MRAYTMRLRDVRDSVELMDLADDAGEALELGAGDLEDEADVVSRYLSEHGGEIMGRLGEVLDC